MCIGKEYEQNSFYPTLTASIGKAYILRNKRGQSIKINPIQYNPISKVLRIYTHINLELEVSRTKASYNVLSSTKIVGRFSGETDAQISTQVNRTVHYEKELGAQDTWLDKGVGIASDEGSSPSDAEHTNTIQGKLEGYGYTITRCYQDGGSAQQLTNLLNNGIGLINYIGHGSDYSFLSMTYTINNVNALTNTNKLLLSSMLLVLMEISHQKLVLLKLGCEQLTTINQQERLLFVPQPSIKHGPLL